MRPKWGSVRSAEATTAKWKKSDGAGFKVRDRSSNVCSAKARERASIWRHVKWTTNGLEWWLRTRGCSDRRVARVSEEGFDLQRVCKGELATNGRRYKLICNLMSEESRRVLIVFLFFFVVLSRPGYLVMAPRLSR